MTVIYIYCVNCMKFGQLILKKVIQIVATRCHILRLKMHQIRFWLERAYSAPSDSLAGFKGAYF